MCDDIDKPIEELEPIAIFGFDGNYINCIFIYYIFLLLDMMLNICVRNFF